MSRKIVCMATIALVGLTSVIGPATAQYRGYGNGYDSGPNYFQSSPAYDPFYRERGYNERGYDERAYGDRGYGGQGYAPPPGPDYDRRGGYAYAPAGPGPAYGGGYGYDQGQPYGSDPAYGGGRYDLGENADNRTMVEVPNPTKQPAGTIVIDTGTRHLYLVERNGQALQYGIGVGRDGFEWKGVAHVQRKAEWPGWTPPADMLKRRPDLPLHMEGGIENPLGARALYLFNGKGDTGYRIHGTNEPDTIGKAVSSGCIRMMNADVIDLYSRVPVGTRVVVL